MKSNKFEAYKHHFISAQESEKLAKDYFIKMNDRRSIRFFSDKLVSKQTIHHILMTASSAPSGANKQPWTFAAVQRHELKMKIREAAEIEEYRNYNGRMSKDWIDDLKQFDTNWIKEFITTSPWIVVVFRKNYDLDIHGNRTKNYYVNESVGIAAGFLISAIHNAGLVTLTHTPSPMNFLEKILNRPPNEKAFLLLPVGYPAHDAVVPVLQKKNSKEVIVYY